MDSARLSSGYAVNATATRTSDSVEVTLSVTVEPTGEFKGQRVVRRPGQQQDVGISDCRGFCVTIEQQVSDKVTLTYITNPSQASQQIIQAEFNINRNLSIVAVRDQYGVVGFDVKWKQRKK